MIAPVPNADTLPFWEACARGELLYQMCLACERPQFYPRRLCASCQSDRLEWRRSKGRGTVASHTTVHRAPQPAFKTPYVIALIDLDEGFRMMVNILDAAPEAVAIGARVTIVFQEIEGVSLPQGQLA